MSKNSTNLATCIEIFAVSEDDGKIYDITYKYNKADFYRNMPFLDLIIDSIEIIK